MIFIRTIAFVSVFLFSSIAMAEVDVSNDPCFIYKPKRASALKAKDWNALEIAAVRFIEECDARIGKEERSKAYDELSMILRLRNDPKNAVIAADRAMDSEEPDCHIEKALVLIQLKKFDEAKLELDVAELIANLALKKNELRLIAAARKDPVYYAGKKEHYDNILKSIKNVRKTHLISKRKSKQ